MNTRNLSLVLAIVAMSVGSVSAQNFFWSNAGFENGAINDDLIISNLVDPSGVVYLYYSPGGQNISEGLDLDFSWDVNGVVGFTAAETLEFDITVGGVAVGDRWGDSFGPASDVAADNVTGFLALNVVNGSGIQIDNIPGAGIFEDAGYDVTADAFLIGSINYEVLSGGVASIVVDGLVVDGGNDIGANFNSLTIFAIVPEPTSASLLALGAIGLVSRRRR